MALGFVQGYRKELLVLLVSNLNASTVLLVVKVTLSLACFKLYNLFRHL